MMAASLLFLILMVAPAMTADWQENPNDCGKRYQGVQSRIIGGEPAEEYAWPWQVYISFTYQEGKSIIRGVCGGSLIDPWWVMTAAHCVKECLMSNSKVHAYTFRVGGNNLSDDTDVTQFRHASRVIVHPGYDYKNDSDYDNDIALFKMNYAFTLTDDYRVNIICLPTEDMDDEFVVGQNATVTGWGNLKMGEDEEEFPDVLYEVVVPIYDQKKCEDYLVDITENMICAGVDEGGLDACQGDSGGPLVAYPLRNPGDQYFQVGIVSWGEGCGKKDSPGVYTRLTRYGDWIKSFINTSTPEIYIPCLPCFSEEEKISPTINIAVISVLSGLLAIFIALTIGLGIYLYGRQDKYSV